MKIKTKSPILISTLEQIEQEKIKRTESLKQRISMFEAARARSNQTDSPPQGNRL